MREVSINSWLFLTLTPLDCRAAAFRSHFFERVTLRVSISLSTMSNATGTGNSGIVAGCALDIYSRAVPASFLSNIVKVRLLAPRIAVDHMIVSTSTTLMTGIYWSDSANGISYASNQGNVEEIAVDPIPSSCLQDVVKGGNGKQWRASHRRVMVIESVRRSWRFSWFK